MSLCRRVCQKSYVNIVCKHAEVFSKLFIEGQAVLEDINLFLHLSLPLLPLQVNPSAASSAQQSQAPVGSYDAYSPEAHTQVRLQRLTQWLTQHSL